MLLYRELPVEVMFYKNVTEAERKGQANDHSNYQAEY